MIRKILLLFAIVTTVSYAQQVRGIDLHSTAKDTIDARARAIVSDSLGDMPNKVNGNASYEEIDSLGTYAWLKEGGNLKFYQSQSMQYYYNYLAQTVRGTGGTKQYTVVVDGPAHSVGAYGLELAYSMWDAVGYGGLGFVNFTGNVWGSDACTVTLTGSWTETDEGATDVLWGISGKSITATGSDSVTVTFGKNWKYARLWYDGAAGTSFKVYIADADSGTITTSGSGLTYTQYTMASPGEHSFKIGAVTGSVILYGVEVWGSSNGVGYVPQLLHNGGSEAAEAKDHMEYFNDFLTVIDPALVMIYHDLNDIGQGKSAKQIGSYLSTMVDSVQSINASLPIITILANKQGSSAYNDSLRNIKQYHFNLIRDKGTSFYDLFDSWSSWDDADNAGLMSDATHPNTQGYEKISWQLRTILTQGLGYNTYASQRENNSFKGLNQFGLMRYDPSTSIPIYTVSGNDTLWSIHSNQYEYFGLNTRHYYATAGNDNSPTSYYWLRANSATNTFEIYSSSGGARPFYAWKDNVNIGSTSIYSGSERKTLSMGLVSAAPSAPPAADMGTIYINNAAGDGTASWIIVNESNLGHILHDADTAPVAVGVDTTWNALDGWVPFFHPTLNDTVWVPYKLNP